MKPSDYAIDNASDTDNRYDTHPCGPGYPLSHSFVNGECEDCGAEDDEQDCDHSRVEIGRNGSECIDCGEVVADWHDLREDFENEQADARRDDWLWESENY
jgi:hypothetical protein